MAHEFPGAFGDDPGDGAEKFFIECASHHNAEGAIRRHHAFPIRSVAELGGKHSKDTNLGITRPQTGAPQQLAGPEWLAWAERISNSADATGAGGAQQGPQYSRK